ncbi:alpha/beta hydrolase [Rhodovulum sulfidophilum]|uniref:alpha/beta fold hydrolase n=1 Tax=Rhodovulum sulfidophilum TaxID=35806 RepID=UPI0019213295|nr:alpha/beta hydrolase [Rhodovulum sulfidophilum]MBL3574846.1 alpha/beta hydrolase [Rhodovulum sulfidophilum]MCE8433029.1 alpha/beta hydrolase [Rhodovulum sulfidophilum]MCF4118294.1 alpha/beta hydrolase [Rhodovulum sulfidophilum]
MIWAGLLVLMLLAAWPLAEALRRPMGAQARSEAPGEIAALPRGRTHLVWEGPAEGPVLVLLHGLTIGSHMLDRLAGGLAYSGYRVLRYDLYGRGFSDRPRGPQDRAFFLSQLEALLEARGVGGELTLVGYSMGGAILTAFAAAHPGRVRQLVLLAPAGLGQTPPRLADLAVRLPGVGDWLMAVIGAVVLRRMARAADRAYGLPGTLNAAQGAETRYRGFLPAVLLSMRHMLAEDLSGAHRRLAEAGVPVLAIWGGQDEVIAAGARAGLAAINPAARQLLLPEAGHGLPVTHADAILAEIPAAPAQ